MKRHIHNVIRLLAVFLSAFSVLFLGSPALAATATPSLSFQIENFTVVWNKDFKVGIVVNAGDTKVNIVQACVNYDHDKLEYVSTSYDNSPLKSDVPKSPTSDCTAGSVQLSRYDLTNRPDGNFDLGSITFRPKAQNGTTVLNFDFARSLVFSPDNPGTNILKETSNQQLTIVSSAVAAKPGKSTTKSAIYLGVAVVVVVITIILLFRKRKKSQLPL